MRSRLAGLQRPPEDVWLRERGVPLIEPLDLLDLEPRGADRRQGVAVGMAAPADDAPRSFQPILPPGVTFADVMASVDELAFTTVEPGFFYGFADFDVRFDNLFIDRTVDTDTVFGNGFDP